MYYNSILDNVYDNPTDDLERLLQAQAPAGQDVRALCPSCFDNLQAMVGARLGGW